MDVCLINFNFRFIAKHTPYNSISLLFDPHSPNIPIVAQNPEIHHTAAFFPTPPMQNRAKILIFLSLSFPRSSNSFLNTQMASLLTPSALLANLNLSSEVAGPIQHDNHAPFLIEQNHLNSVLSHITTLPVSDPTPLDKLYIDIKPDVVARIEQISHILLSLPPKAPLYISIAPQCGGKTTALRKSLPSGNSTIDVTIDDQPGIYVPVSPTEFISGDAGNPRNALPVCGKILKRRLVDPSLPEQRFVLKRLVGELTTKEFRDSIFKVSERSEPSLDEDGEYVLWTDENTSLY